MFTLTLALDPMLLRGLRRGLSSWLDLAGAPTTARDSIVLATHEAAAHAMQTGELGSTVDVTASRADDDFVVEVRNDAGWALLPAAHGVGLIAALVSDVSVQASTTIRLRHAI